MSLITRVVVALGVCSTMYVVACGGDDDDDAVDGGGRDASADATSGGPQDATTTPPRDAAPDAGPDAAARCSTCGEILAGTATTDPCEGSFEKLQTAVACACDPSKCAASCVDACTNQTAPSDSCISCGQVECSEELGACIQDDGVPVPQTDAGTDSGAGDAGDAGD